MLEQTGNNITFYAQFLVSGAAGTGLTVTCTVYKGSDGSTVVSAQAATEIGGGLYKYQLSSGSVPAEDDLVAVFNEAAATADQTDVPSMWSIGKAGLENLDAPISSRLASGSVTVSAPVDSSTNALTLTQGDDYKAADSREVSFSSADWPDLTAASAIVLTIRKRAAATGKGTTLWTSVSHRVAGLVAGGGTQTVEFEPLVANTALLASTGTAAGIYDVQATLASGSIVTLVTGAVTVLEEQTRA
jgi:hypothetical protein